MNIWKRNAVIAAVVVLICGGLYLNWYSGNTAKNLTEVVDADKILGEATLVLNDTIDLAENEANKSAEEISYFAQMRLSRQNARDQAVNLLQEAMAYAEAEEGSKDKESAMELETIVETALSEAQIESLVIAKGYTDCVAYISDEGISVAVAAPEGGLTQNDVAVIADIILTQSDYDVEDIRIVEVQ